MSSQRRVLEASAAAHQRGEPATLVVVVATEGSTYVRPGAMALFGAGGEQVGWLSGGCLEPEIAVRASVVAVQACIEWMDIDTRDDEDLIGGSALGCRGRLRLALLPLAAMPGWPSLVQAWQQGQASLQLRVALDGRASAAVNTLQQHWQIESSADSVQSDVSVQWQIEVPAPPAVLVFGAGPETPVTLVEFASRADQRVHAGTLSSLPALALCCTGPAIILFGLAPRAAIPVMTSHEEARA